MSSLIEMLGQALQGNNLSKISQEVGTDEATTKSAISAALPALIGALSKNGSSEQGAESLLGALKNDQHDGGILDNLSDFLGQKKYDEPRAGAGILGHLLGEKRERVEQSVGNSAGISSNSAGQLMKILAPMVLGALGKQQKQQGLDAGSLMGFLGGEKESVEKESGGLLGKFLDQDGDGDFDMGDMAKVAMGKIFGGK